MELFIDYLFVILRLVPVRHVLPGDFLRGNNRRTSANETVAKVHLCQSHHILDVLVSLHTGTVWEDLHFKSVSIKFLFLATLIAQSVER